MTNTIHVRTREENGDGNIKKRPSMSCKCNTCCREFNLPTTQQRHKHTGRWKGRIRLTYKDGTRKRKTDKSPHIYL